MAQRYDIFISCRRKGGMQYVTIFLLLSFAFSFAAGETMSENSQLLPLTAQLQKNAFPWFVARNKNGQEPFSTNDLKATISHEVKRVALVFFATWCIPCREGVVLLRDNQTELDKNGVQIVLVNAGESDVPKIESWVKTYGNEKWPLVMDKLKNIQKSTGLISDAEDEIVFPKTILLDNKLKPLILIGTEGKDWPEILWK